MGRLFGTDGVRGIANDGLGCELATEIGRAAATLLSDGAHRPLFVIGSDTRASSPMLIAALAAGISSVGADVMLLGVVPTPAVAYLTVKYGASAGVMISASHNPAEYNGIKLFGANGYKLPDMLEERIEDMILEKTPSPVLAAGGDVGGISLAERALDDYTNYIVSTATASLDGLDIAIDTANGSASVTAKGIFERLGATVHMINDTPNGTNINKNCGSTHLGAVSEFVRDNHLYCGVAFDGDADRCLFVDENGEEIDGDVIMAICALDLKKRGKLNKDTVVGTIMTNFGFSKFCDEHRLRFVATRVGDRYVLDQMLLDGLSFGGEQSGHLIFKEYATTGDGQLTAVQLLSIAKRESLPISELARVMTRYPQITENVTVSPEGKINFYKDEIISERIEEAKRALGDTGRIVVRPSGTEPLIRVMTEGSDTRLTESIAKEIADVIKARLG